MTDPPRPPPAAGPLVPGLDAKCAMADGSWGGHRVHWRAEQGEAGSGLGRRPLPCQCGAGTIAPAWVNLKASKQASKQATSKQAKCTYRPPYPVVHGTHSQRPCNRAAPSSGFRLGGRTQTIEGGNSGVPDQAVSPRQRSGIPTTWIRRCRGSAILLLAHRCRQHRPRTWYNNGRRC
jgi:hypothetical protein